jgi:hypothetical protein
MKYSTGMCENFENERMNYVKLAALVSNLAPLSTMKEAKERMPQ